MWDHNFVIDSGGWRFVICRRFKVRVESNHLSDEGMTLLLNLLSCTILTGVQPLALAVVDGLRRRRPVLRVNRDSQVSCTQFTSQVFNLQLDYIGSLLIPGQSGGNDSGHARYNCLLVRRLTAPTTLLP